MCDEGSGSRADFGGMDWLEYSIAWCGYDWYALRAYGLESWFAGIKSLIENGRELRSIQEGMP